MENIVTKLRETIGLDAASIGRGAIERAVQKRIAASNMRSLERYRELLRESPDELRALIDVLVVPETWFFRDRGAFAAVAAEAKTSKHPAQLRYLCVPCASGEEPLSLAMTLLDSGVPAERFHIDAFDISERLVTQAQRGVYGRNSFRGNDADFRARYFRETSEGCAIHPVVRRQTTFRRANLLDDPAFDGAQIYDAVFCRNLLIYFDSEAQQKAVRKLSGLLRDDGLLCVAPAETGLLLRHGFEPADVAQAFAFRNRKRTEAATTQIPARRLEYRHPPRPLPLRPREMQPKVKLAADAIPKATESAAPTPSPLAEAMRLANEGRFDEVSEICRAHIDAHGASADAYCLLALVSDASARYEEAATLYRKALYLDPQHREALAHFSLLADKLGETAAAGALRRRALRMEPHVA
jgi:chemotaxis protein methyltransferase WspC